MITIPPAHTLITRFLLDPGMRIYRHLLLLMFILVVIWNVGYPYPESNHWTKAKCFMILLYSALFLIIFYSNIYWAVPRYLLKNRIGHYLLYIFYLSIISITTAILIQIYAIPAVKNDVAALPIVQIIITVIASMINVGLMMAGISAVLLFRNWIRSDQAISELQSATLQTELDLLKNQINPHFLFNMLNNANVLLKREPKEASTVLFKLEDLLRYQMEESEKEKIKLSSDIHFLKDYLQLEKIRRDDFEFCIFEKGNLEKTLIPPLLFIPFVENAVKYSPDSYHRSYVYLSFFAEEHKLSFICINSKPHKEIRKGKTGGLGLKNIQRRLELLFPGRYRLEITDEKKIYTVNLQIEL
ncbi:MAG: histidine kinase [Tannerellaceae bacterium]|nr:histidine kinase [Tannerellaceae bacterium]